MNPKLLLAPVALLPLACAGYDPYIPEERATATLSGRTAASYSLPSDNNPQSDIRVASSGISNLERRTGEKTKAVHVRLAIANHGAAPMSLDVRQQRIQLKDGTQIAPAAASSTTSSIPVVDVPTGSSRVVDMLFPIGEREDEKQPSRFDVVWRVNLGNTSLLRVTPFDEVDIDPSIAQQDAARHWYYNGPYWYDPLWMY